MIFQKMNGLHKFTFIIYLYDLKKNLAIKQKYTSTIYT